MEKPTDRARGGMASDRLERTPGPTTARQATIRALATTAIQRRGAMARPIASRAATKADTAMKRKTWAGPRASIFIPTRAPTTRPSSSVSCTGIDTQARCSSSRSQTSS